MQGEVVIEVVNGILAILSNPDNVRITFHDYDWPDEDCELHDLNGNGYHKITLGGGTRWESSS